MILSSSSLLPGHRTTAADGTGASQRPLVPGRVDLWLTATDALDAATLDACEQVMSAGERERADRFLVPGPRRNHLVARALLRTTLSAYADVDPRAWAFGTGAYGKPFVGGPETGRDLRFNLSHADGLVALAVTEGRDVGVDIEDVTRPVDAVALARSAFAPEEADAVARADPAARADLFFALWTLKEAYLKATGVGLQHGLDRVTFDLDGDEPRARLAGSQPWRFHRATPTPRHALALAVAGSALDLRTIWTVPCATRPASS